NEYRGKIGKEDHHAHAAHDPGGPDHGHAGIHEPPFVMWGPLAVPPVLSLVGGWLFNIPQLLLLTIQAEEWRIAELVGMGPCGAGIRGILIGFVFYDAAPGIPEGIAKAFRPIYTLIYNKYFVDELYDAAVVEPAIEGSRTLLWRTADAGLIDGTVNGIG